jgi:DNA invertase Pin-like site-specific DNA recombinase
MENTTNPLLKAFGYIRVSGESQVDGDGPVRQRQAIKAYAAKNGIKIVKWFVEEAVSGTVESKDRPAFSEMLVAMLSNGVRTVLIEKLDRIAREVYVQEGLYSEEPSRVAMRQMMGVFAQLDRANIVLKLRAARQRKKAATGRCEGRKPFGHREGEQATILRMRELHGQGLNYTATAAALNAEGFKTRTGSAWFPTTVSRTLAANK